MEPALTCKALLGKTDPLLGPVQPALDKNNVLEAKMLSMILNILYAYIFDVIVKTSIFRASLISLLILLHVLFTTK